MDLFWILIAFALIAHYPRVNSTDDSIYFSQLNNCLASINDIPSDVSAAFEIKRKKNHIELVVNHGTIDYYELGWRGNLCYRAQGLDEIPIRTDEEQEDCDTYQIGEKMDFYRFECAFKIYDDKKYSIMFVDHYDGYFVNKETGYIVYQFYKFDNIVVPHDESDDTPQFLQQLDECVNKKNLISNDLPVSFEITKRNSHIELLAHYENIYDYYEINWQGSYCYRALGVNKKPNRTLMENEISECDFRPLSTNHHYGRFKCGYDVWTPENEDDSDYTIFYITQSINGAYGSNAYIINKSTRKVVFQDFPHEFSGDSIFERYKEIDPTFAIKQCSRRILNLPESDSFKFDLQVNDTNVKIIFGYEHKFDYYELYWNSSVRVFESRLDQIPEHQISNLSDMTDSEFKCPYNVINDEEYFIIVVAVADSNSDEAYVYFINKITFEINFTFYPSFYECILEVPALKKNVNPQFSSQLDSCLNLKNSIPDNVAISVNISRINNHIRITVNYDGKFDYYGMNYNGLTCYVYQGLSGALNITTDEAMKECDKRRATHCSAYINSFACGFEVYKPKYDHYLVLAIRSGFGDSGATYTYSGANVYLIDELTNKVDFRKISIYREYELTVPQTEFDKNPVYTAEFEECLNLKNSIPSDFPIEFNVTKVNNHINILVYDNGNYDYYEHNARGEGCFTAVRKETNPTRTAEDQMDCDNRRLHDSLKPYSEVYKPQFRCGYEVSRNDSFIFVFIHSSDGLYEYDVDRTTRKTELYFTPSFYEDYDDLVNRCAKRKYLSEYDIPLEVTKKPKDPADSGFNADNYLEILVKYQGKYDLYVTEESGYVRYSEMQLQEEPHLSISDYLDKIQCRQNTDYRIYHNKNFRCPLKVVEDESYVNISINALHYENVYVIDKSSNGMKYYKVKDNLILSNLPIPDADLNYIADVDECIDTILNVTSVETNPFPVDVVRNIDFLEIIVKFNETFDVYETTDNGREMCNISYRLEKQKPSNERKVLADVHPECLSCDGPRFIFNCPYVHIDEDENRINLEISHGPGLVLHSYTLVKSTGEMLYGVRSHLGPPNVSRVLKSMIG